MQAESEVHPQLDSQGYWDQGFAFPLTVMSAAQAGAYRQDLESLEAQWSGGVNGRALNQFLRVNAQCVLPLAARLARHPQVVDCVSGVLGPDVLAWSVEFMIKEAGSASRVTMHQDLTYWGFGGTDAQVTAWLALSPSVRESGCMAFVAGSHKNPILRHRDTFADDNLLSRGQELEVEVREEDKEYVELAPGQMSLHHGLMIHGSGPNTSEDRRIGVVIRYVSPQARQLSGRREYALPVRGENHGSFEPTPVPEVPFSASSLALYDRILAHQSVELAAGAEGQVALYSQERRGR